MIDQSRPAYVLDIEVYYSVFLVAIKRLSDGKVRIFELSDRSTIDHAELRSILLSGTVVTFNGMSYDIPVLYYALTPLGTGPLDDGDFTYPTNADIKRASDTIIRGGVKWWDAEKTLDITIPSRLDHIDLIEPQPNPFASLKALNGRMHGRHMQDLPYHFDDHLTHEQIDKLRAYNVNDLDATEDLNKTLAEAIELRIAMGKTVGQDLRSKSDTQMGLAIIKKRVEQKTGKKIYRGEFKRPKPSRYEIPNYIKFHDPALNAMLGRLRSHDFIVNEKGKVDLPEFLTTPFRLGDMEYAMGIGGLHSTESNRAVHSDDDSILVDADVSSYYPAIILSLGLYPELIGPVFLDVYRDIRDERVAAKRAKNRVIDKALKIALNGTFGSLGSIFSIVYAPHLLIAVTITGQLALLMLIERALRRGFSVASANTDGVVFRVPRDKFAGIERDRPLPSEFADLLEGWERDTQFDLECNEYRSLYSASVNSYFAIKADGGHKRKGPLGNPWSKHPDDFDAIRGQLMKNPQATICSDAALARIKDGTPISHTIRRSLDIRDFVTVIKVTKGGLWRDEYLGKTVRFYWAKDGDAILEATPHPSTGNFKKAAKTEGCRPCMTLPDNLPLDIDYDRYEAETEEILKALGYYGTPRPELKMGRITASKIERVSPWLTAA